VSCSGRSGGLWEWGVAGVGCCGGGGGGLVWGGGGGGGGGSQQYGNMP